MKKGNLDFTLLENAFDYILDAVDKLKHEDSGKRAVKYAILHLWSGIQLLLKQKLMDEHWSLIFGDINKASKDALESGDFISVDFNKLIERLRRICDINLDEHRSVLLGIRKDRNKLEHFRIEMPKLVAVSKLVKAWNFILDFSSSQIDFAGEPKAKELFDGIRAKIIDHEKFIKERWDCISPELEKNKQANYPYTVIECPICFQEAMFLLGGDCECRFCRVNLPWQEAMDKWLASCEGLRYMDPKELMITPLVYECPGCGMAALYKFEDTGDMPPQPGWICFHCGETWAWDEIEECERCGNLHIPSSSEDLVCGRCWKEIREE